MNSPDSAPCPPSARPDMPHDVIVAGASAGGLAALRTLLRGLPGDFPLPVVAMFHLPPDMEVKATFRQLPLPVRRLEHGQVLEGGTLWVCPPRSFVELLPDGSCVVRDNARGALGAPIDRLFGSMARSFGPRGIAVILSGMGKDGAAGVRDVQAAGGRVLVQSPGSAEFDEMPAAAIATGAASLVVPLADMAEVIAEFANGAPRGQARSELRAIQAAFGRDSAVAGYAQGVDWQLTPLGPALVWPEQLKLAIRETIDCPGPCALWWGAGFTEIHNDAWAVFLGARQAGALGAPASRNWPGNWDRFGPLAERVLREGTGISGTDEPLLVHRHGVAEEAFVRFAFAPLRNAGGAVIAMRCTICDVTDDVVARRRLQLLHRVGMAMAEAGNRHEACSRAAGALAECADEVSFALIYLLDNAGRHASLACTAGLEAGSAAAPRLIHVDADDGAAWPLAHVLRNPAGPPGAPLLLDRPWNEDHARAVLVPLYGSPSGTAQGVAVFGLARHRPYDDPHERFLEMLGRQVATGLGDARAKELERERADRLAALDRARTDFFANVSHEFRTPLTLLLAPLEDLARHQASLPAPLGNGLDVAVRNARRLLRLVDSLLDFAQAETRARQLVIVPSDIGALTLDIASAFRSAIEEAGLALRVEVPDGLPPVPLDPALWEQVVSNLLSNAFKFTFEGAITVRLKALHLHVELEVADTGEGIPASELPDIFKRFHRVQGARARTAEGSGIGLSLVQDAVHRMGGQLTAHSTEGRGSTFKVWLPKKSKRRSAGTETEAETETDDALPAGPQLAAALAGEASRWSAADSVPAGVLEDVMDRPGPRRGEPAGGKLGRLLIVDDNADLRAFLCRLLQGQWHVRLAPDGLQGLALAREEAPDIVLADVMMPQLDGFELLKRMRQDPALAHVPCVLLTARASEEDAIEGLRAGAEDYIAKPFSPRELMARLQGVLERSRTQSALRRTAELKELQERQRMLVGELQHRTRNLLAVVRFTANRTLEASDSLAAFRERFGDRLDALARVQGLLSRLGETDRIAFDELLASELASIDTAANTPMLDGETGIGLRSRAVQVLALALHELASNAARHGALAQPAGRLVVRWRVDAGRQEGRRWLCIDWREENVHIADAGQPPVPGNGIAFIREALPYQLGASTTFAFGPDGVHCTIELPID